MFVSKLRAEGVDPNAIRLALLAGHYRTDRPWTADLLDRGAGAAGPLARAPSPATPAPDADELVGRLRAHLADDLDTPGALAAVDAWAAGAERRRPRRRRALVRDAVDALLGVAL